MKVLAFDTALSGCSAALWDSETGRAVTLQQAMMRGQSEALVPMIQQVVENARMDFPAIDLIAVTIGPGAFTGLRIGLSTAQGFGLALDKPVVGLVTTEILAAMFFAKEKADFLGVLIETKRADYYCQYFNGDGSPFTEPQALSAVDVRAAAGRQAVYIGDALGRFAQPGDTVKAGYELPDPAVMARLGFEKYREGAAGEPKPLYLREADVSVSKKKQRVILEE